MGHGLMVEKLSVWALSRERGRGQDSGSRTPSMPVRFGCGPSRPKTKAARQHRTPRHPMCGQLGTQLPLLVACALSAWLGGMHGHDVRTSMPGMAADAALCYIGVLIKPAAAPGFPRTTGTVRCFQS